MNNKPTTNPLTLIRQARNELEKAYNEAQRGKEGMVTSELLCIEAVRKVNYAIIELRKDNHES